MHWKVKQKKPGTKQGGYKMGTVEKMKALERPGGPTGVTVVPKEGTQELG